MRYAHAIGAATKTPADATVRIEHADAVAEEGHRNRETMSGGGVQPYMGVQHGVHRGGGDLQVPGKDIGPVGRRLADGTSECQEGPPGMEPAGEAATEGGGGDTSFSMFYREVVQAVLLFGAKTWVLSEAMYRNL